jgi:hypothetical protein
MAVGSGNGGHDIGAENRTIHKQGLTNRVRCKDEGEGHRCAQGIPESHLGSKFYDLKVGDIRGYDVQGNGCIAYTQGLEIETLLCKDFRESLED